MLMNHKNFHFTQISDKTNDVIFLKSPKTLFLSLFDNFWSFLPDPAATNNYIWAPNTMLSFRKKIISQFQETYGQTEGRTDRSYFIGLFRPSTGFQQQEIHSLHTATLGKVS